MTRTTGFSATAILAAAVVGGGCTQAPAPKPAPAKSDAVNTDDHGHAHADHGHAQDDGDHDAHGTGPHDGVIAEWGNCVYHLEFTVDHDRKEAVVYVLGTDEKTPAPVKTPDGTILLTIREPAFQIALAARPLAGEADGTSSCYGGKHESLGLVREFAGTISGEVDGTPYAGDFAEEPHDDHDHK